MTKYPLAIEFRPLLLSGLTGGIRFDEQQNLFCHQLVVMIASGQSEEEQRVALFHEMLHIMLLAAGVEAPHPELWIEERAKAMAAACPDILDMLHGARIAKGIAESSI